MKELKNIIFGILIIIIILIVVIFFTGKTMKKNNIEEDIMNDLEDGEEIYTTGVVTPITDANIYYSLSKILEIYFEELYINEDCTESEINEKSERLYNILDKNFTKSKNINKSNVLEKLQAPKEKSEYMTLEINELFGEINYQVYSIKGFFKTSEIDNDIKYNYFKIMIDNNNNTYSIYPIETNEDIDLSNIEMSLDNVEQIEKNENNKFNIIITNTKDIIKDYIMYYKYMQLHYPEKAYKLLDNEYRTNTYRDLEEYKSSIKNTEEYNIEIERYSMSDYEDYTQYTVVDNHDNHYIIKERRIMKFSIEQQ